MPFPPAPPPPPPAPSLGLVLKQQASNCQSPQTPSADRSNLLNEIRKAGGTGGRIQLKKTMTNDRSAPVLGSNVKSSPVPVSNGPSKPAGGGLKVSSNSCSSFQEQLNAAVKGVNRFGSSSAVNVVGSQQKAVGVTTAATSESPRPLPPTPLLKSNALANQNARRSKSPTSLNCEQRSTSATTNQNTPSPKNQAPSPPSLAQRPAAAAYDDRRLRSLTAGNAEIAESTKLLVAKFSGVRGTTPNATANREPTASTQSAPPTNQNSSPRSSTNQVSAITPARDGAKTDQCRTLSPRDSTNQQTMPSFPTATPSVRPPPPSKPAYLAAATPRSALPPPPPPTRPPSQRPPLDQVAAKGGRRPDFRTLRPQKTLSPSVASPTGAHVHRSSSDENLRKDQACGQRTSGTNRPAPPPPPQRPPPLPPSVLCGGRPSGAPPPPPPPQFAKPKPPAASNADSSTAVARRSSASALNGANCPPPLPESAPPPLPPPRTDSLTSDFEKRFRFRTLQLLPCPDDFVNSTKHYPAPRGVRKSAPRAPDR